MPATIMDGKAVAAKVRETVAARAARFEQLSGRQPGLGTLLVGEDPASATYIRMKRRACADVGIASLHMTLPAIATQQEVEGAVLRLVSDERVDGVLVQMPLPEHLDEDAVVRLVPPAKDVDGFHPESIGYLALNTPLFHAGTPAGVMALLDAYDVELEGAEVLVIGRSRVVGMPMALQLLNADATVTIAHHLSRDLPSLTCRADVIVSATGVVGLIQADMVKPGAVVVDVGTVRTENGLVGDVEFAEVSEVASLITPVPGGVGPMTIATLLECTVKAAEMRVGTASV